MARPSILRQVKARIENAAPGDVFIPSDFSDLAEAKKITMCLSRLLKEGSLTKVRRGVYMKPRFSTLLNRPVPPRADVTAKAIARNFGWTIVPCGDTALNMLGLSTQVPAVWQYVSDGPYKTYAADGINLQFKHTDRKNEIVGISEETALVIQALRALGKEHVDARTIQTLARLFTPDKKKRILQESRYVTAWIHEAIKAVCREEKS